jgi:NDP-sugar pyrophosphorylase family protein
MGALALCKDALESDSSFMVLMGDDIYEKDDLKELSRHENAVLLIKQENVPGGRILIDDKSFVSGIREGLVNKGLGEEFVNTGAYLLDKEIFNQDPVLVKEGEYGLPQTFVERALNNKDYKVKAVFTESWINITSPESIKLAEELLK